MAFDKAQFSKVANLHPDTKLANSGGLYLYKTADNRKTVLAAGYFNTERAYLQVGDMILAVCSDGVVHIKILTVPASGNITYSGQGARTVAGQKLTVTASDDIDTGLTTVLYAVASLEDAPVLTCLHAQAVVGDQVGAPAAGHLLIKTWKPTAANDATPIAASTFGKKVNWIAYGT